MCADLIVRLRSINSSPLPRDHAVGLACMRHRLGGEPGAATHLGWDPAHTRGLLCACGLGTNHAVPHGPVGRCARPHVTVAQRLGQVWAAMRPACA
jgi:hypothetical protein